MVIVCLVDYWEVGEGVKKQFQMRQDFYSVCTLFILMILHFSIFVVCMLQFLLHVQFFI